VTTADTAAGTRSPVVFPAYVHGAGPLDPAEVRSIHEMLAPVARAMDEAGMTAGGLAVTAGPHGLEVSSPDRADGDPGRAKLAFARNVLRSRLTADGTLWQAPASSLLGDEEPGLLVDTYACRAATVQALPLPGAGG